LKEYAAVYQAAGQRAGRDRVAGERSGGREIILRQLDHARVSRQIILPDEWHGFRWQDVVESQQYEVNRIPKNAQKDYAFAEAKWPDGTKLMVGAPPTTAICCGSRCAGRSFRSLSPWLCSARSGRLFAHRALLPVRQMVATAQDILRTGNLDARVPTRPERDELDEMVRLLNALLDKEPGPHPRHARIDGQRGPRFAHAVDESPRLPELALRQPDPPPRARRWPIAWKNPSAS